MGERLKELRKLFGLTQEEFAKRIGIKRNTIATYEIGRNTPIDAVIFSICREFNVNEDWLRAGEGEMLIKIPEEDETAALVSELLEDDGDNAFYGLIKDVMKAYDKLSPNSKKVIEELCTTVYENKKRRGD